MKQSINTYPYFAANQVLKSRTLNDAFEYNSEQERITRSSFIGHGIVSGLDYKLLNGVLTILPGEALTRNGWYMEVNSPQEYRYAVETNLSATPFTGNALLSLLKDGGSRVAYICFKTYDEAAEFHHSPIEIKSINKDNYILGLVKGVRNRVSNRCNETTCDINISERDCETWPVLINYRQPFAGESLLPNGFAVENLFLPLEPFTLGTTSKSNLYEDHRLDMRRVTGIGNTIFLSAYRKSVRTAFDENKRTIIRVGDYITNNILGQPAKVYNKFEYKPSIWDNILEKPKDNLSRFHDSLVKINTLLDKNAEIIPDYCISFLSDYAQALREFVEFYNYCAGKHEYIPVNIPTDNIVYLGDLCSLFPNGYHAGNHYFRSKFYKAIDDEYQQDLKKLKRFFKRIILISECFIGPNCNEDSSNTYSAKLVLSKVGANISDRPIPFYYNSSSNNGDYFEEYWRAAYDSSYIDVQNYKDAPAIENSPCYVMDPIDKGNALYLMGIHNKSAAEVIEQLNKVNESEDLGLEIEQYNYTTPPKAFTMVGVKEMMDEINALSTKADSSDEKALLDKLAKTIKFADDTYTAIFKRSLPGISETDKKKLMSATEIKEVTALLRKKRTVGIAEAKTLERFQKMLPAISEVEAHNPGLTFEGPIFKGSKLYILTNGNNKVIGYATK